MSNKKIVAGRAEKQVDRLIVNSRGFSLFTPLIGTSMVIMAILISAALVQNDSRLSRGLSASYEVTSQGTIAKLIQATASAQMVENINARVSDCLNSPSFGYFTGSVVCSSASQCVSEAENTAKDANGCIVGGLTTGNTGLYNGVTEAIAIVTGYSSSAADQAISDALRKLENAFDVKFQGDDLLVTVN